MKRFIIITMLIAALACSQETPLDSSFFISDPDTPELPIYSELGYNTFGAKYERKFFLYDEQEIPLKILIQNDSLALIFQGIEGDSYQGNPLVLTIYIPENEVQDYWDLLSYHDRIIDLSDPDIKVDMISNGLIETLEIEEGMIHFKHAQKVLVDEVEKQVVLSGTFELSFLNTGIPARLSEGRFDFGVNDLNFFSL